MKESHAHYMQQCIELAKIALKNANPPVGAIIVHNDQIIGIGIESGKSTKDITNHAEILAVRDAIFNGSQNLLSMSEMYTTHEPCIMCSYLIRHYKIPHIIYGASVGFIGGFTSRYDILCTTEVPKWGERPQVTSGICEKECQLLTEQFIAKSEKKK